MYIKVTVTPKAKKAMLEEVSADHFKVSVKEPAERNLANRAVVLSIARHFKVPQGKVRIVSGHHSHSKILSLDTD